MSLREKKHRPGTHEPFLNLLSTLTLFPTIVVSSACNNAHRLRHTAGEFSDILEQDFSWEFMEDSFEPFGEESRKEPPGYAKEK